MLVPVRKGPVVGLSDQLSFTIRSTPEKSLRMFENNSIYFASLLFHIHLKFVKCGQRSRCCWCGECFRGWALFALLLQSSLSFLGFKAIMVFSTCFDLSKGILNIPCFNNGPMFFTRTSGTWRLGFILGQNVYPQQRSIANLKLDSVSLPTNDVASLLGNKQTGWEHNNRPYHAKAHNTTLRVDPLSEIHGYRLPDGWRESCLVIKQ